MTVYEILMLGNIHDNPKSGGNNRYLFVDELIHGPFGAVIDRGSFCGIVGSLRKKQLIEYQGGGRLKQVRLSQSGVHVYKKYYPVWSYQKCK